MRKLYIGSKNYSSWSMRPWVLMRQCGIDFDEVRLRLADYGTGSVFKQTLLPLSPVGKVPVLVDGDRAVWDSLAIAEYLAEQFPDKQLWPSDVAARTHARSLCAEMHSGFTALRSACPMNIEAQLPQAGALALRDKPGVATDLQRIVDMWSGLLQQHGGPMLFGAFSIADAYFAPVVMRLRTYALPVPAAIAAYMGRVCALPGVKAWMDDALQEQDFIATQEPFRLSR